MGCQVLAEAVQSLSFSLHRRRALCAVTWHLQAWERPRLSSPDPCGDQFCRNAQCQSDTAHHLACWVVLLLTVAIPLLCPQHPNTPEPCIPFKQNSSAWMIAFLAFLERQADPRLILLWPCVHYLQEISADRKPPRSFCVYHYHWCNRGWGLACPSHQRVGITGLPWTVCISRSCAFP